MAILAGGVLSSISGFLTDGGAVAVAGEPVLEPGSRTAGVRRIAPGGWDEWIDAAIGTTSVALFDWPDPLHIGQAVTINGGGITPGTVLKVHVATATGPVDVFPSGLTPTSTTSSTWKATLPWPWPVPAPNQYLLGNGFAALQFVRTDRGYDTSSVVGTTLLGDPAKGVPSILAIDGLALSLTSSNPSYAVANVEHVVVPGQTVSLAGSGFAKPRVNLFTASGNMGPIVPASQNATDLTFVVPPATPTGPGSIQVVNTTNYRVSNAVSVQIGGLLQVQNVSMSALRGRQSSQVTVDGSGFSGLTVINFFAKSQGTGNVTNFGGLDGNGDPRMTLFLGSDREFSFVLPVDVAAGLGFVEALNPPFIPYASSGAGDLGKQFAALSFNGDGSRLFAMSGQCCGEEADALYEIDQSNAHARLLCRIGHGDGGEAIAFHPTQSKLFHSTFLGSGPVFESVEMTGSDPCPTTSIPLTGSVGTDQARALAYWPDQQVFLSSGMGTGATTLVKVTTGGAITFVGDLDHTSKGLAFPVPNSGQNPYSLRDSDPPQLKRVNPSTGATVSTLNIGLVGKTAIGASGLATHPVTGELFALLVVQNQNGRELVKINPANGVATSIGNTDVLTASFVVP